MPLARIAATAAVMGALGAHDDRISPLVRRVAEGVRMGEDMPDDPFEVAESFAGPLEAPFVSVVVRYPQLETSPEEGPTEAVVTIVRLAFRYGSAQGCLSDCSANPGSACGSSSATSWSAT